jgi:RHS repeat-associated protein
MGFRDYDPGLNRFLSRDMFNGALADLNLATDPWTMNRYAFAGGNPISMIELDGHGFRLGSLGSYAVHTAMMFAGVAVFALGAGVEVAGIALDLTVIGATIGIPANIAGLAIMAAGATMAGVGAYGYGQDLAATFGTHAAEGVGSAGSGSSSAQEPTPVYGSQEGAAKQQGRAEELQRERETDDPEKASGTTTAVRVWNRKTGEERVWIATETDDSNESDEWWSQHLREGEEYVRGKADQHAEEKILSKLGQDWVIVEGGTSRNICGERCNLEIKQLEYEVGGRRFPGARADKTPFRRFWRPPPSSSGSSTRYCNGRTCME